MADYYWVGGSGNWSDYTNHWATTSGGSTKHTVAPTSADNVYFDANSDTGTDFTVTINTTGNHAIFDNTAVDVVMTINGSAQVLNAYGNVTLKSDTVIATFGTWRFQGATSKTITSNGAAFGCGLEQYTAGGEFILGDAVTTAGTFYLTAGTLTLNGFNLTCKQFYSSGTAVRQISFGTNKITITGSGDQWYMPNLTNYTQTGTPTIETTYVGTDPQNINHGGTSGGNGDITLAVVLLIAYGWINWQTGLFLLILFGSGTANYAGPKTLFNDVSFQGDSGTDAITFGGGSACPQQVTFNGYTMNCDIYFDSGSCGVRLMDSMNQASSKTTTLKSGTLYFGGNHIKVGQFSSANSNTRGLDFSTYSTGGYIEVYGSGAYAMNVTNAQNLTVTGGEYSDLRWTASAPNNVQYVTWTGTGITASNILNVTLSGTVNGGAGNISMSCTCRDFTISSSFNGGRNGFGISVYGDLLIQTTFNQRTDTLYGGSVYAAEMFLGDGNQSVTMNGEYIDFPLIINKTAGTITLLDDFRTRDDDGWYGGVNFRGGTLDLNGHTLYCSTFSSDSSSARTIDISNPASRLQISANLWNIPNATNFSILTATGQWVYFDKTNRPNAPSAPSGSLGTITHGPTGAAESNSPSIWVNNFATNFSIGGAFKSLYFNGVSTTNLAMATTTVYGDLVLPAGGTRSGYSLDTGFMTFAGSGAQTIDGQGALPTLAGVFSGAGPYNFASDTTFGATAEGYWGKRCALQLLSGTIVFGGYTVTAQSLVLTGALACGMDFTGGGALKLTDYRGDIYLYAGEPVVAHDATNFTLTDPNYTGTIWLTYGVNMEIRGLGPWPVVSLSGYSSARTLTISAGATWSGFKYVSTGGAGTWTVAFPISGTNTFRACESDGYAPGKMFFQSVTAGTQANLSLTDGFSHIKYVSFKDINATGGGVWNAPVSNANVTRGNTTGINFGAANFISWFMRGGMRG